MSRLLWCFWAGVTYVLAVALAIVDGAGTTGWLLRALFKSFLFTCRGKDMLFIEVI